MAKASLAQRISAAWYQGHVLLSLLRPLASLFDYIAQRRRKKLSQSWPPRNPSDAPLIVVGNIAVGGTGKTPLIIALVKHLQAQGLKPGVISRGHGSAAPQYPYTVTCESEAACAGDEPLLIAQQAQCPVVIDPQRNRALSALQQQFQCDVVLSDDGLQHYAMRRDIEIAVLDAARGLGNGLCLPAGPLREGPQRLHEVDLIVSNGANAAPQHPSIATFPSVAMALVPFQLRNIYDGQCRPCDEHTLAGVLQTVLESAREGVPQDSVQNLKQPCLAMAGIGNPQRFFSLLESQGLEVEGHPFDDHQAYSESDLTFAFNAPLLMTAKDAVKCQHYQGDKRAKHWWQLDVQASLSPEFWRTLDDKLAQLKPNTLR